MSEDRGTATPSLRRRVLVVVVALFAALLLVVGVSVDVALGHQLRSDLSARLNDGAARAVTLAEQGYSGQQLAGALQGDAIRAQVRDADGAVHGGPPAPEPPQPRATTKPGPAGPGGPGPRGPDGAPGPGAGNGPPRPASDSLVVSRKLPGGSTVTLTGDTTSINEVRRQLRLLMVGSGAVTLLIAALTLGFAVRRALRPLDAMVSVARGITSGDRGRRVHPRSPSTELGRAASSMDEMLDALEASGRKEREAADAARRAEANTRRFLADAAHELRTPIAGLSAVAESLRRDGTTRPDRVPRWTELLVQESAQAARLVADLLDMARIDSDPALDLEDADLVEVVRLAVERAQLLAPQVRIVQSGPSSVPAHIDSGRIGQVVSNLIDNAVRVSPPGAAIEVDVRVDDAAAFVTVTDEGPGVPDPLRERIFERLVRLDESRSSPGAGLGLPIARALARAHGGDVACLPRSRGAQFELVLPLRVSSPAPSS